MANIQRLAKKCADNLQLRASSAGTAELFRGCIDVVVDLAIALNCNQARNTGDPGYGILFEAKGREHAGQFSFFATRPKMNRAIVALAISDKAVGQRAPELHALVHDLCRHQGVAVAAAGKNTWPAIGFTTVAAGEQIIQAVSAFLLNQTLAGGPSAESMVDPRVLRKIYLRRGQPAFRQRLLAAYDGRCVVTGCNVVEALEAAHITPYSADGEYATSNGMLMRADIHTLSICIYCPFVPIRTKCGSIPDYGRRMANAKVRYYLRRLMRLTSRTSWDWLVTVRSGKLYNRPPTSAYLSDFYRHGRS